MDLDTREEVGVEAELASVVRVNDESCFLSGVNNCWGQSIPNRSIAPVMHNSAIVSRPADELVVT
jgi:hypothetical protein